MFTKAELIEKGRHYFDNKEVNKMHATPDGNFFYENSKNYADSHAKSKKDPDFQVIEITRADLDKGKSKTKAKKAPASEATADKPTEKEEEKKEESQTDIDELRKEAKGLKIKGYHMMGLEKLKKKIAESKE